MLSVVFEDWPLTFTPKMFPHTDFLKLATPKGYDLLSQKGKKRKMGITDFGLCQRIRLSVSPKILQLDIF